MNTHTDTKAIQDTTAALLKVLLQAYDKHGEAVALASFGILTERVFVAMRGFDKPMSEIVAMIDEFRDELVDELPAAMRAAQQAAEG